MYIISPTGRLRAVVLVCFSLLAACTDGTRVSVSLSDYGIDDGASKGEVTTALVDGSEEVRLSLKTGASVTLPKGAVDKKVEVSVERPPDTKALKLIASLDGAKKIASAPYVLTPHGSQFKQDVTVSLPVAEAKSGKKLVVAWLEDEDDTDWKLLSVPETDSKRASVKIKHFSVLMLVEEGVSLTDAGTPDGGMDAGTREDASMGGPTLRDSGTSDLDGSVEGDAFVDPDGGPIPATGLLGRMYECGLVAEEGVYHEPRPESPVDVCWLDCLLAASCADIGATVCGSEPSEQAFYDCADRCYQKSCLDQTGATVVAYVCDDQAQCADGSDEVDCRFECGDGTSVDYYRLCDGSDDCEGGEDELDCEGKSFYCEVDQYTVPMHYVCDGDPDCSDSSDEPADCIKLSCDPAGSDADAGVGVPDGGSAGGAQ